MLGTSPLATGCVLSGLLAAFFVSPALAGAADLDPSAARVAIKGYDTTSYFVDGRPERGNERYEYAWRDARWRFASAAHRDLFATDPQRYAPRFGGFCAMGMANGATAEADPEAWAIVDGKLYLNFDEVTREEWRKDVLGNVARAQRHWDELHPSR